MTTKLCHAEGCSNLKQHGRGFRYCEHCAADVRRENRRVQNARWLSENYSPEQARRYRLMSRWGITPEEYDALLAAQGGRCANPGCRTDSPGARGFHIDHDHSCCPVRDNRRQRSCGGCIRGLLCAPCNRAAGFAGDDPRLLRGLADYLESSRFGVVLRCADATH